jgi:hypothetical protein
MSWRRSRSRWCRSPVAGGAPGALRGFRAIVRSPWAPLLLAVPSFAAQLLMPNPWIEDPPGFIPVFGIVAVYAIPFAFGWLLFLNADLLEVIAKRAWLYAALAVVASIAYRQSYFVPLNYMVAFYLIRALHALAMWLLILGVTGLFLRYLGGHSVYRRYLCDSSYFLYIAHMPVILAFQLLLKDVELPPLAKMAIALVGTIAVLMPVYRYAVRPTFVGAVLNGPALPVDPRSVLEGGPQLEDRRCPRRCSLIRRPTSTASGSAVHGPNDIPVVGQHGPGRREGRADASCGLRHGDRRRELLQRRDAREVQGPQAHRLPRHRGGELHRHRRGRRARASRSRPSAATATPPWPSMRSGLVFAAAAPHRHHARHRARRRLAADAGHGTARQDAGHRRLGGIGREMARSPAASGSRCWPTTARPARARCRSTRCWRSPTSSACHSGLNDQTRGFLNRERLGKTKQGVIIVNTARAGVVDEPALIDLLKSRPCRPLRDRRLRKEPPAPTSRCSSSTTSR